MLSLAVQKALVFATQVHGGQVRNYTGEPYVVHLIEVMMLVQKAGGDENQLITSLLHDVLEDTDMCTASDLSREFNQDVSDMVVELTDQYTVGNRKSRKKAEAERLWTISPRSQTIKYADMISNTSSIVEHAPEFAKIYVAEKEYILYGMRAGDAYLYWDAWNHVQQAKVILGLD